MVYAFGTLLLEHQHCELKNAYMNLKVENPHWKKMQQELVFYINMQMNNFDIFFNFILF